METYGDRREKKQGQLFSLIFIFTCRILPTECKFMIILRIICDIVKKKLNNKLNKNINVLNIYYI